MLRTDADGLGPYEAGASGLRGPKRKRPGAEIYSIDHTARHQYPKEDGCKFPIRLLGRLCSRGLPAMSAWSKSVLRWNGHGAPKYTTLTKVVAK